MYDLFLPHLKSWDLEPDGDPFKSPFSYLLPVRYQSQPAMLKLLLERDERRGSQVMARWNGQGAARIFELDDEAVLMERATGDRSLTAMVTSGQDDQAAQILAGVIGELHAHNPETGSVALPLKQWFDPLWRQEDSTDPLVSKAFAVARELFGEAAEPVVLHGDIHHGNVLDFGARSWLAIDPKGLIGARGFDYTNIFRNPPTGQQFAEGRMERIAGILSTESELPVEYLLRWALAYLGLSMSWATEKNDEYFGDRRLAAEAIRLLGLA